jgi:nucleotide-binding universal stress UspA family protein
MTTTSTPTPIQVLVAFDLSPGGGAVVDRATDLACRAPNHVLHFVSVIDPGSGLPAVPGKVFDYHYAEQVQSAVTAIVRDALAAREPATPVHFFVHARIGDAAEEVLLAARELSADLIVVGSHGYRGVARMLLGSVSERIVREAGCPVIVARAKTYPQVELLEVVNVGEHASKYIQPHRYSYEDASVKRRPSDWPLY